MIKGLALAIQRATASEPNGRSVTPD